MKNLEQTVENFRLREARCFLGRGIIGIGLFGLLVGCGGDGAIALKKDASNVYQGDSKQNVSKKDTENGEVNTGLICLDKTFGGDSSDKAYSIQQTADLGYIVAGHTFPKGAEGANWIFKLDSDGDLEWDKTFEGGSYDDKSSIQQTKDGGYIVAGVTSSKDAGKNDAWILKLDSNGELEWDKTFGGSESDGAVSIQQTNDSGYIVAGYMGLEDTGNSDTWIFKLDSNGNLEWDKIFEEGSYDYVFSIQQTADLGYIMAGQIASKNAGYIDAWILKLDSTGTLEWDKTVGAKIVKESGYKSASSIRQTTDLGYIAAGNDGNDAWVFKLNSNGDLEWDKTLGETGHDYAYSVQQTKDEGYIVAGDIETHFMADGKQKGAGGQDAWIIKLDPTGNLEWDKTFGGWNDEGAYSIQQTNDGGYIVAGYVDSKDFGQDDAWIFKLDENGNLECK